VKYDIEFHIKSCWANSSSAHNGST